jgi:hypothetical protein
MARAHRYYIPGHVYHQSSHFKLRPTSLTHQASPSASTRQAVATKENSCSNLEKIDIERKNTCFWGEYSVNSNS